MNKQRKVLITTTYNEMGVIIDTKAEEVAQPNLQPTCNQLTTDTISRQQAIDALQKCRKHCIDPFDSYHIDIQDAENQLMKLPTIQPEPQWILCEERMPEEYEWLGTKKFGTLKSDEVYVTFENEKGERFCKHLSFQNGKLSSYDQFHMDTWFKGSKPIAWRPLPKPFEGGIK